MHSQDTANHDRSFWLRRVHKATWLFFLAELSELCLDLFSTVVAIQNPLLQVLNLFVQIEQRVDIVVDKFFKTDGLVFVFVNIEEQLLDEFFHDRD